MKPQYSSNLWTRTGPSAHFAKYMTPMGDILASNTGTMTEVVPMRLTSRSYTVSDLVHRRKPGETYSECLTIAIGLLIYFVHKCPNFLQK